MQQPLGAQRGGGAEVVGAAELAVVVRRRQQVVVRRRPTHKSVLLPIFILFLLNHCLNKTLTVSKYTTIIQSYLLSGCCRDLFVNNYIILFAISTRKELISFHFLIVNLLYNRLS